MTRTVTLDIMPSYLKCTRRSSDVKPLDGRTAGPEAHRMNTRGVAWREDAVRVTGVGSQWAFWHTFG